MRLEKAIIPAALVAALASGGAAYAWTSDGNGNIRCGDGSRAMAVQKDNGNWTVTQAGKNGHTGGDFSTEGKAAAHACGEE